MSFTQNHHNYSSVTIHIVIHLEYFFNISLIEPADLQGLPQMLLSKFAALAQCSISEQIQMEQSKRPVYPRHSEPAGHNCYEVVYKIGKGSRVIGISNHFVKAHLELDLILYQSVKTFTKYKPIRNQRFQCWFYQNRIAAPPFWDIFEATGLIFYVEPL